MKLFQDFPKDRLGALSKLGGTTLAYISLGEHNKAEEGIAKLKEVLQSDSMGWGMYFLILAYAMMGKYDDAIQMIEEGITHRSPLMITVTSEPILKALYSIPRFQELIEQIVGKKYFLNFSKEGNQEFLLNKEDHQSLLAEPIRAKKKPLLDAATNEAYSKKLLDLITTKEPYLDSNLTLKKLADSIDIHSNQLSWLLNQYFGKSFNEFINHYRVETFKQIAKDPKNAHITLIGLAYESGFNSKTVFNTYFKKETGTTPKKWLLSETK
ncbi:MAG: helix-turn-helix domain-containing protein [Saprospiraceae bacterium]